jgi:hypothetical protein
MAIFILNSSFDGEAMVHQRAQRGQGVRTGSGSDRVRRPFESEMKNNIEK